MRKIAIITGSRGEYGYIRPIIKQIEKDPDLDYFVVATNMHPLTEFGYSLEEIKKDKFKIEEKIYNTFDGYNPLTMTKSLAVFLMQLPEVLDRTKPDIILTVGDRGEQLMAAIAGAYMYIPVAHIQSGEVSGNIDGTTRHAITKFAHFHFCANQKFAERVKMMGEQEFRIFVTGAPQIDELVEDTKVKKEEVFEKYHLSREKPLFLLVQHPVTAEYGKEKEQMKATLEAILSFDTQIVAIFPNSDAGNKEIKAMIEKYYNPNFRVFRNLPREYYLGLMKAADLIIGNSSSAIIEAPVFKLPAVNIGSRQQGRLQAENVINVNYNQEEIKQAIKKALSQEFKGQLKNCSSPYGDGKSSERIVKILKEIEINDKLLNKKLTY
jgi:GDP/UDP-N,N'-diacetylbacillosamine 2-epimerase (hydrolysing)